jgi:hypothetical protein
MKMEITFKQNIKKITLQVEGKILNYYCEEDGQWYRTKKKQDIKVTDFEMLFIEKFLRAYDTLYLFASNVKLSDKE